MKIVFDTNVLLSAFITQGLSTRVLDICIDYHQLFISEFIINEVVEKLEKKFKVNNTEIKKVKNFLINAFVNIKPESEKPSICRDRDDNNILHLADYINADIIITGDKDLLDLKVFNKIDIITPRQFMEKYYKIH
jgi:putative PIN family toxin of toxin-antitoxin system